MRIFVWETNFYQLSLRHYYPGTLVEAIWNFPIIGKYYIASGYQCSPDNRVSPRDWIWMKEIQIQRRRETQAWPEDMVETYSLLQSFCKQRIVSGYHVLWLACPSPWNRNSIRFHRDGRQREATEYPGNIGNYNCIEISILTTSGFKAVSEWCWAGRKLSSERTSRCPAITLMPFSFLRTSGVSISYIFLCERHRCTKREWEGHGLRQTVSRLVIVMSPLTKKI